MKIGIFGGSFNPPHNMHLNIALELIKNKYLDKIVYVPTGDSYNKKGLISFKDRLNMVNLMIENYAELSLSNIGNDKNYEYTYQTLDYFKKLNINDDIYFICGTDNLNEFNTWKNYEIILENYKLLVIKRNNDNIEEILKKYINYKDSIIIANIKSQVLSSTTVRENLKNDIIDNNINEKVYSYIKKNNLYK